MNPFPHKTQTRFQPLTKEQTAERYKNRSIEKLPADLLAACDEIRSQKRELNSLRAQLLHSRRINVAIAAILGGAAAKGIEVGVLALIHFFAH